MKVFITGGLGFVGSQLTDHFLKNGYSVVATGTRKKPTMPFHPNFSYITADTRQSGVWQTEVADADIVINLAGRSIFHYWTKGYKQKIYDSRVLTTRNVMTALSNEKPVTLLSVSAVGIYGDRQNDILTETEPPATDFLAQVCVDWEKAVTDGGGSQLRRIIIRSGIVLSAQGGAFPKMTMPLAGGPLGNGNHWFPWIHVDDYVNAVAFLIKQTDAEGVFNFCSPLPVRNRIFSKYLGEVMNRPNLLRVPGFVIKLVLREFGETLLSSQRAHPDRLLRLGFKFQFTEAKRTLQDLTRNSR